MTTFAALGDDQLLLLVSLDLSLYLGRQRLGGDHGLHLGFTLGTGLARLARFTLTTGFPGLTRFAGLTGLTLGARFVGLTGFPFGARLAWLTRFTLGARFVDLTRFALGTGLTFLARTTGTVVTLLATLGITALFTTFVAIAVALTWATALVTLMAMALFLARLGLDRCSRFGLGGGRARGEDTGDGLEQLADQASLCRGGRGDRSGRLGRCGGSRRGLGRLDEALQQRLFPLDGLGLFWLVDGLGYLRLQLVAHRFGDLILANAGHLVVGGLQVLVRDDVEAHVVALLETGDGAALLVEQVGGNIHRHLGMHLFGIVLERLFFDETQDGQRQ